MKFTKTKINNAGMSLLELIIAVSIFAIAAVNDEEHLKLFQAVANYLMIEGSLEELMNCKNKKEMIKEIIENE